MFNHLQVAFFLFETLDVGKQSTNGFIGLSENSRQVVLETTKYTLNKTFGEEAGFSEKHTIFDTRFFGGQQEYCFLCGQCNPDAR